MSVREVELLVADGDVGVGGHALGGAYLVRPEQAVHGDGLADHAQHAQALPAAQRVLGDGDLVAALRASRRRVYGFAAGAPPAAR